MAVDNAKADTDGPAVGAGSGTSLSGGCKGGPRYVQGAGEAARDGVGAEGAVAGGAGETACVPATGLPPALVAHVACCVAEALEHAHGRGVLHRDVKGAPPTPQSRP